jgi:hypothetical protein
VDAEVGAGSEDRRLTGSRRSPSAPAGSAQQVRRGFSATFSAGCTGPIRSFWIGVVCAEVGEATVIVQGNAVRQMDNKDIGLVLGRLMPDEQIVAASPAWVLHGSAAAALSKAANKPGVLVLTDRRVLLAQKGKLGPVMGGEVDLQDVLSVEYEPGTLTTTFRHQLIVETRSGQLGAHFGGRGADKRDAADWPRLILRTQEALVAPTKVILEASTFGLAEQLARLSELHAIGALNSDEFHAAKARLLQS